MLTNTFPPNFLKITRIKYKFARNFQYYMIQGIIVKIFKFACVNVCFGYKCIKPLLFDKAP